MGNRSHGFAPCAVPIAGRDGWLTERIPLVGSYQSHERSTYGPLTIGGSFGAVLCDGPGSLSIVRAPPNEKCPVLLSLYGLELGDGVHARP